MSTATEVEVKDPTEEQLKLSFEFEITKEDLLLILNRVDVCREEEATRFALAGTYFEFGSDDEQLTTAASDGREMAIGEFKIQPGKGLRPHPGRVVDLRELRKLRARINSKSTNVLVEVFNWGSNPWMFRFSWDNGSAKVYKADCKVLEGRFPNWRTVLPDPKHHKGTIDFYPEAWVMNFDKYLDGSWSLQLGLNCRATAPTLELPVGGHHGPVDGLDFLFDIPALMRYYRGISGPAQLKYYGAKRPIETVIGPVRYVRMPMEKPNR